MPDRIERREIIQGESFAHAFVILDDDGAVQPLGPPSGSRRTSYRIRPLSSDPTLAPSLVLSTDDPAEYTFLDGGNGLDGEIAFLGTPAQSAALPVGQYDVAVRYEDSGSGYDDVKAEGVLFVRPSKTGPLS